MGFFSGFFAILFAGFLIFLLYNRVKNDPEAFSTQNLSKSAWNLGILALILVGLISFVVILLNKT